MFAAPCDSCGREWKVPSAGRVYRCRACDGRVTTDPAPHAEPDAASERAVESRLCRDCGRPIDDESDACPDCSVRAAPARRTRHANRFQDALLSGRVKERMSKGVAFTQTLFILRAVTMGALLFVYFAAERPSPSILAGAAVPFAVLMVSFIGIFRAPAHPLFWSGFLAAGCTITALTPVLFFVHIPLALCAWKAWNGARKWNLLAAARPGLASAHGNGEVSRGTQRLRSRVASPASGILAGLAFHVAVVGSSRLIARQFNSTQYEMPVRRVDETPPAVVPPFDPVGTRFVEAWNGSRIDEIVTMLPEGSRRRLADAFDKIREAKDWATALPPIVSIEIYPRSATNVTALCTLEQGELETSWVFRNEGWRLTAILPNR